MKRYIRISLLAVMVVGFITLGTWLFPYGQNQVYAISSSQYTTKAEVSKYSYSIKPIIAPISAFVYVKTDNMKPDSFRFYDKSTKYPADADSPPIYVWQNNEYLDVAYEKTSIKRVKGGYIFSSPNGNVDGEKLTLQYRDSKGKWNDTGIIVNTPKTVDSLGYIISEYTNSSQTFFEKMDSVQKALEELAVYPTDVFDNSKPTDRPYPFLAVSPYPEMFLNLHYDIYERTEAGLFINAAYPYVLDSYYFPLHLFYIARELEPTCTVYWADSDHSSIKVEFQGESAIYGGQGKGDDDPIYLSQVKKEFLFNGSDLGSNATLSTIRDLYLSYGPIGDQNTSELENILKWGKVCDLVGDGSWVKVATEGGFEYYDSYAFIYRTNEGITKEASDDWVDGRYINRYEQYVRGAKLEEHPTSDIIISNFEYDDCNGDHQCRTVEFYYNSSIDAWKASLNYYVPNGTSSTVTEVPDELILTREELAELVPDRNTYDIPASGLLFDGTELPGTPFENVSLTGIELPEEINLKVGEKINLPITYSPDNATEQNIKIETDNSSIVLVDAQNKVIKGLKAGTAAVTIYSVDGNHSDTVNVTVTEDPEEKIHLGDTVVVNGSTYKVINAYSRKLVLKKAANRKSVVIPAAVKVGSKDFKVTQIGTKAFKGSKIRKVTIGKNVIFLNSNAFRGSKAKTVILKTKLLKKGMVENCLAGSKVKTIRVDISKKLNRKYVKKYRKIFTKKNAGRKVRVK